MANFNESDYNFYNNVYLIMQEESEVFNDDTTNTLVSYYKNFIDNFKERINDEEYLGNEETYKKFRDCFLGAYKSYGVTEMARFAMPLFVYLFDQDPIGFNLEKFDAFVFEAQHLSFSEMLSVYDAFQPGMDLNEKQAIASR